MGNIEGFEGMGTFFHQLHYHQEIFLANPRFGEMLWDPFRRWSQATFRLKGTRNRSCNIGRVNSWVILEMDRIRRDRVITSSHDRGVVGPMER